MYLITYMLLHIYSSIQYDTSNLHLTHQHFAQRCETFHVFDQTPENISAPLETIKLNQYVVQMLGLWEEPTTLMWINNWTKNSHTNLA